MRILVIHRYFWPDTPPYATLLRAIADRWADEGHEVSVLTSQPSYNRDSGPGAQPRLQTLGHLNVRRARLLPETKSNMCARVVNLFLFMLRVAGHIILRRRRFDVVMAATTPPVMIAWIARLATASRGGSFIYHCQDIHPELLYWSGHIRNEHFYNWLRVLDSSTMQRATEVVVLSRDMERTIRERPKANGANVRIINNFVIPDFGGTPGTPAAEEEKEAGKFRVLFAGNMGNFQGLEGIVECARRLQDRGEIEFVFVGDGAAKSRLTLQAGELVGRNVRFLPYRPQREVEKLVGTADLCLVTLAKNIIRAAFPSKTMTYLSQGCPLLVLVEPDSDLAEMTKTNNVGYVARPDDAETTARLILDARESPEKLREMRANAARLAREAFDEDVCLDEWSRLLLDITDARQET